MLLSPYRLGSGPDGLVTQVKAEGPTCHPQAPAVHKNTMEPGACQAGFPECPDCLQAAKLEPGVPVLQGAHVYLSRGLQRPECSLKIPNSFFPNPERGLNEALGRRQPRGLVQRGRGGVGSQKCTISTAVLPTSSLRTDHILLLCGQRRPGAGEGGRARTRPAGRERRSRRECAVGSG